MAKCIYCHKDIPTGQEVRIKSRTFACKEHIREGMMIGAINDDLRFILGDCNWALMKKLLDPVLSKASVEKVRYFLQDRKDQMNHYLNQKEFSSDYHKICYFRKMLDNGLNEYKYADEPIIIKEVDDGSQYHTIIPKRKKKKSLNEILGG